MYLKFLLLFLFGFYWWGNISNSEYYDFVPEHIITIYQNTTFNTSCWNNIDINFNNSHINYKFSNKTSLFCSDLILWGPVNNLQINTFLSPSSGSIKINNDKLFNFYGFNVFNFKNGIFGSINSIIKTYGLFKGPNIVKNNIDFLHQEMGLNISSSHLHPIPNSSSLKSGDVLLITAFDGLDQLIMWGTGSTVGHTAMALEFPDGLYIIESTDKNPFGHTLWPPPYGFIKTPYLKWMELAKKADYQVRLVKLNTTYHNILQDKLELVHTWWNKYQGHPYGYYNLLWPWIDTINDNFPKSLSKEFVVSSLYFLNKHNLITDVVNNWFSYSFNKRIETLTNQTSDRNFTQIIDWTIDNNLKLWDLWILPEQDNYQYNNSISRVCVTLILSVYKLVGIIPENIQVTRNPFHVF